MEERQRHRHRGFGHRSQQQERLQQPEQLQQQEQLVAEQVAERIVGVGPRLALVQHWHTVRLDKGRI